MILTIKLNIGDYQSIDFQTNEYDNIANCYTEVSDFLGDWVDYTSNAVKLKAHVEAKGIVGLLRKEEGEISVDSNVVVQLLGSQDKADSKPKTRIHSPGFDDYVEPKPLSKTSVVETRNFVDVRECKDYNEKSYILTGYDNRHTWIAKSHVIRTDSIEGGGTRVIVSPKSAWVISKLEWK